MAPRHSFSTEVDFTMPKFTEEQYHNAIGRLQAGSNQGDVDRHIQLPLTGFGCVTTTMEALVTYLGQADRDRPPQPKINTFG